MLTDNELDLLSNPTERDYTLAVLLWALYVNRQLASIPVNPNLSQVVVIRGINQFANGLSQELTNISLQLINKQITLTQWQLRSMSIIEQGHIAAWGTVQPVRATAVKDLILSEFEYLNKFANQLSTGQKPINGSMLGRVRMYGQAVRGTYYESSNDLAINNGAIAVASVLHPTDHCPTCIRQAAKGFMPFDELIPIGKRDCLSNCRCTLKYKYLEITG